MSADGESVILLTADSLLVDQVDFGPQISDLGYARVPNGAGPFQIQTATFAANNDLVSTIAESINGSELLVFPNPAHNTIALLGLEASGTEVRVSDAVGREMWSGILRDRMPVDVASWSAGPYLVRAGTVVEKFMIVR